VSIQSWSPDGSRIAFYKQLESEPPFKLHGLGPYVVVNADGTGSHERIDATEVLSW
jgi:hypothetical protein